MYIIQGEVNLLVTAMRRNSRWLSSHSHQDDEHEPLLTSFSQLKDVLCSVADLDEITPSEFLSPFLAVIRSEETTGPITGLALTSINKFLSYGLIESTGETAALAIENIADAVTHARFVGTDPGSDEVVLMKILHVLRTLLLTPTGAMLSNESVCEIMQSCFRICFEMRLSELLRKSAEHTLVDMVQLLFSRLPQFKEDAKWATNMRKLKMRTGTDQSRTSKSRSKKLSAKAVSAKTPKKSPSGSRPLSRSHEASAHVTDTSTHGDVVSDGSQISNNELITSSTITGEYHDAASNETNISGVQLTDSELLDVASHRQTVPPSSLSVIRHIGSESAIDDVTLYTDITAMATTPVASGGLVVDVNGDLQDLTETPQDATSYECSAETESVLSSDHRDQYIWNGGHEVRQEAEMERSMTPTSLTAVDDSDVNTASSVVSSQLDPAAQGSSSELEFVNPRGVRFSPQSPVPGSMYKESQAAPPIPYGLPCVRELLRFLVSLINPYDQHNTDVMIHMGLSLLTIALESGADHVPTFRSLLTIVKDEMAKNLIFLLKSERVTLFAAAIRVCFLLFESMRGQLKLQLEMYVMKLMDIIVSESPRVSYEQREIALESIVQLLRIPGFVTELYLNYDCDLYCSSLFEDLMKLLSKNAFPVSGLYSTHLLSLDALLAVIDSVEQHCHHRILSTTSSMSAVVTPTPSDQSELASCDAESSQKAVVLPCPPSSGFIMSDNMAAREVDSEWTNASPTTDTVAAAKVTDSRICPRIRPNRMKVSLSLPMEEELSAIKRKKKIYQTGTEQFNVKPLKGISYLQEHGLLSTPLDPKEVVTFIKENPKLDKKQIGEFISNKKYGTILEEYQKSFNFDGIRIDEALRMYLESFRLPGEAPVISYILEHFADHWHKANGEPFVNADAAFTLAYAVIMLNVDQHNTNAKKQNIPMTAENFKRNLSKVNGGKDFDEDMLDELFTAIKNEEIVMPAEQVGLVKDNYMWKILMKRSTTKEGNFMHAPTGAFDRDLFGIVWGPTVAALSFVFDKSNDEVIIQKAISGFRKCAMISAHYGMSDVFDNLVISLCKFTTLLTSADTVENIPILFGNNSKAQLAARTVFGLAHRHSDILHDGWKNILDCMLQLYRAKLLAEILVTVEDFLDPNGRISLIREDTTSQQRTETGVLSSFYSYFTLSDTPQQRGPTADEQEAIKRAQDCIQECHVEQLIMESKFLRVDSLQELLKAMIYASRCLESHESLNGSPCDEDSSVFFLELLIKVVLQNRDRMANYWQSVQDHLYSLLVNATEHTFLVERAVVGLLRLAIRLLRRDEIAAQVLGSLRMLLMMKPDVIHSVSRHIAYGLHDLLKTNAANIHVAHDWCTLFVLLEVVGAGINPPPVMQVRPGVDISQVISDAGAQSDSEISASGNQTRSDGASDRGYTSDSELYDSQSRRESSAATVDSKLGQTNHGSWLMVYRDEIEGGALSRHAGTMVGSPPGFNQYSIELSDECNGGSAISRMVATHDMRSLIKCCETLAFLVRDAAHITPHNFTSCVHTIRTFVEASVDGGVRMDSSRGRQLAAAGKKGGGHKHTKKYGEIKKSRSSPCHLANSGDDDRDPDSYQSISIQLLDLMHTLHTKAAAIFSSWAHEAHNVGGGGGTTDEQEGLDRRCVTSSEVVDAGTSTLWAMCWCPLLQGIARLCCDSRRNVRSQALTYLQRALLMHDLQTLSPAEWESCFNKVLFPLLSKLLEQINPKDPNGIEETRMRASTLLCKVFLQHLSPLLTLPTFTALWLTILEFMDKYMHADRSDLLSEAIPESLKNMLLVMHTAGILQHTSEDSDDESQLWKLTWDRIDAFLPSLREDVFKPRDSDRRRAQRDDSATPPPQLTMVQTQQPLPSHPQLVAAPHEQQHPAAVVYPSPTSVAKPAAESGESSASVTSVAPPACSSHIAQYILHPPLPVVIGSPTGTSPEQLTAIPLLLNPDILQSSSIPVITPQNTPDRHPVTSAQP